MAGWQPKQGFARSGPCSGGGICRLPHDSTLSLFSIGNRSFEKASPSSCGGTDQVEDPLFISPFGASQGGESILQLYGVPITMLGSSVPLSILLAQTCIGWLESTRM
jgi:hypothetical protein